MFFPRVFTFDQPWGDDNFIRHLPQRYQDLTQPNFELPLDDDRRVMHITHFDAAKAIITSGYIAQQKAEDEYTYIYDQTSEKYIKVQEMYLLYDGYYSWWFIELNDQEYNPGPLGNNEFGVIPRKSFLFEIFSMYGTVKLSLKLNDLVKRYAESRSKHTKNVCYKKGGTLRYTKEVCYVIIVCVDTDDKLSHLETIDESQSLEIKQPYSFFYQGGLPHGVSVSWDHYAFALYYPRKETLELGKKEIDVCSVEHFGFNSNGSYNESLLQTKTHKCFQIIRKKEDECPDYKKFKNKIPIDELKDLLSRSEDMSSQLAGMTLQDSHVDQSK